MPPCAKFGLMGPSSAVLHVIRCGTAALLLAISSHACESSGEPVTVGNVLVFCHRGSDGNQTLNVLPMDDGSPLRISGRASIPSHYAIHSMVAYGDQLIVLLWDQVEIYSLADPSAPSRVAAHQLKKQRPDEGGFPHIEPAGDNGKFMVLSPIGAAELRADPDGRTWSLVDVELTADLHDKAVNPSAELVSAIRALVSERDSGRPRLVKETSRFRYELFWKTRMKPGEIFHTQYLRKVDKSRRKAVGQFVLCEELETID